MKVLIDVNLSEDWADFFVMRGIEAVHWSTVGHHGAPDPEIMAYALRFDYIVLTQDLDFGTILSVTAAATPSVIQIRAGRVHPTLLGDRVLAALQELETELRSGSLVTVEQKRTRLRILPFSDR